MTQLCLKQLSGLKQLDDLNQLFELSGLFGLSLQRLSGSMAAGKYPKPYSNDWKLIDLPEPPLRAAVESMFDFC
ncbi:hypothetical protein [Arthrobacter sp. ZGTC212]|uniref:hypothetical protein n=1 Tax=Arthrobacter sp. ZGTC212 TaxID=2058899 RepID=UPI0015E242B1|nr:hypothetical protein [Arthrobacter sp. ZGTC212]